jgi:fucose permease
MGFSVGAFLYVATESAIYVWMPSYLVCDATNVTDAFACYTSSGDQMLAMYAVAVFFSLSAAG